MEIFEAYDLTSLYRGAADLVGCSHHTVKKAVEDRAKGMPVNARRAHLVDDWAEHVEGWVENSKGETGPIRPTRSSSSWGLTYT